jgi:hypothetical protein
MGLIVDPSLSEREIRQAVRDGCDFYSHYAYQFNGEKTSKILIEWNPQSSAWGRCEPCLMARPYTDGLGAFGGMQDVVCYIVPPDFVSGE